MFKRNQGGFTLLEMLVVIMLAAIITVIAQPKMKELFGAMMNAERKRQEKANAGIANALLKYARTVDSKGQLPQPYSGTGYYSVPVDPANPNLVALTNEYGIVRKELNDDGKATRRMRVYQLEAGQTLDVPLHFQSGPLVRLTYGNGVVYQTDCASNAPCNKAPYAGVSPAYTSANATTWEPTRPEYGAASVSTLPLQQAMLSSTAAVIDRVRDALLSYYKERSVIAAANDQSNFYPTSNVSMAGRTAASNQGCRDGWYPLNDPSVTVLDELGLTRGQYGVTAWGGAIEFCRKYDLAAIVKPENEAPHYGALRINFNVSQGISPSGVASENVVVPF